MRQAGFIPEGADYFALEDTPELDFIPDDPAELRCAVTDMAAHINVADWRFIKLVAAMDCRRGWDERGYCNLGNWLDHRCGLGPCAARERIRIGRALARLPRVDAAFRDGILSYSKVRAITRVATRETEAMLLSIAHRSSAAQLESLVRTYQRVERSDGERRPSEERRGLSWHYEDGMLVVTAAVPAERGALLINALQKIVDARADERDTHYQSLLGAVGGPEIVAADGDLRVDDQSDAQIVPEPRAPDPVSHEERPIVAADAPGDVSAGTARDLPAGADDLPAPLAFELASHEQRFADALVDMAEHSLANGASRRERRTGRRYEVVLTIGRNELAAQSTAGGARYHVDPDWGIDEEDARQIACDADLTEFIQDARGNLLNYGRRRRIVPGRLLRALKLRDHSRCRFPGCPHQRHVEAHHVRHWIDGGETRLDNLVLLCSAHHRLLHHGAFHITADDDEVVFISRDGEVIEPALRPQFPELAGAFPLLFPREPNCSAGRGSFSTLVTQ
ncbi:MAG: DUF222 domain-containing protein [Gammaproteobacteria bacterium]|nr:DUF222 domain-containing protein [Gammaproteobacteria bacterium]